MTLLRCKLAGKSNLQLGIGTTVLPLMGIRRFPEALRILTRELGHVARFDQLQAAALLVLAIAGDVLRVRRCRRCGAGRLHHHMNDGQASEPLRLQLFLPLRLLLPRPTAGARSL
jgi:hypothetical protein